MRVRTRLGLPIWRALLFVALGLGVAWPAGAVDLIGTWHVLIHYKDSSTIHSERERWDDRMWVFQMEGSRLRWTEYPIVVFTEKAGRFEPGAGGRQARTLQFWEPSPNQAAEIEAGLQINPRGSRNKTLRGDMASGFTSGKKKQGYQSARFITFTETWSIEGLPDQPVFTFDDVMGSASTESFEGRTQYSAESISADGNVIRGTFQRDDTRTGTFRLQRAGATRVVEGNLAEAQSRDGFRAGLMAALASDMMTADFEERIGDLPDFESLSAAEKREVTQKVQRAVEEGLRAQGNRDFRAIQPELQNLSKRIVELMEQGKTTDEIVEMFKNGQLRLR